MTLQARIETLVARGVRDVVIAANCTAALSTCVPQNSGPGGAWKPGAPRASAKSVSASCVTSGGGRHSAVQRKSRAKAERWGNEQEKAL